jgi:transposase
MVKRYGLTDAQWARVEALGLPGGAGYVGVTAKDNRLFVEAVLFRFRAGVPWRDLPARFGDWHRVFVRFDRWGKSGVWERIFDALSADADNEYALIDSAVARAHRSAAFSRKCAAGARKKGVSRGIPEARGHRQESRRLNDQDSCPVRREGPPHRADAHRGSGERPGGVRWAT